MRHFELRPVQVVKRARSDADVRQRFPTQEIRIDLG